MIRAPVIPNEVAAEKASRGVPTALVFKPTTLVNMLLDSDLVLY